MARINLNEAAPVPAPAEAGPKPPELSSFNRLMAEVLEIAQPALTEEMKDVWDTNGNLALTAGQVWEQFKNEEDKIRKYPDYLRKMDTVLRGRDLGSMRLRALRQGFLSAFEAGAITLDLADKPIMAFFRNKLRGNRPEIKAPGEGFTATLLNLVTDDLVNEGANWGVRKLTGIESVGNLKIGFASPLAFTIGRIGNMIPRLREVINPIMLETEIRKARNIPIVGVPVEKLTNWLNRKLMEEGSIMGRMGGYMMNSLAGEFVGQGR